MVSQLSRDTLHVKRLLRIMKLKTLDLPRETSIHVLFQRTEGETTKLYRFVSDQIKTPETKKNVIFHLNITSSYKVGK